MAGCRPLEQAEIGQALRHFSGSRVQLRNRCMLLMGLYTGFRISELLSLRVGDVIQDGRVPSRVRVERRNMKGKLSGREVVLNERARKALADWLPVLFHWRGGNPDLHLFQSQKGGSITREQAWHVMSTQAKRQGWQQGVGTHSLRKTFAKAIYTQTCATYLPGQELPIRVVQKALGHRGVDTTEKYLGLDVAVVDNAVMNLNYGART